MSLLEREAELDTLSRTFASAAGGRGSVVLVSGEAGIGKTSLVRAAVSGLPSRARVLRGACDDLIAPRSFGPLRDAVRGVPGPLAAAVAAGRRPRSGVRGGVRRARRLGRAGGVDRR